eukprot:10356522-Prorocentrum_lima.AAC.1
MRRVHTLFPETGVKKGEVGASTMAIAILRRGDGKLEMRLSLHEKGTDKRLGQMIPQNDGAVAMAGGGVLVCFDYSSQLASAPAKRHDGGRAKRED